MAEIQMKAHRNKGGVFLTDACEEEIKISILPKMKGYKELGLGKEEQLLGVYSEKGLCLTRDQARVVASFLTKFYETGTI